MSKTFTEQAAVPSANINADGDGMHGYLPYDLIRGLNNLGTYVNPHVHYAQSGNFNTGSGVSGITTASYVGAARECFMLEIPVLVPFWAVRMVWTVGARGVASTLTTVTTYLSRTPYTGADGNSGVFDFTGMTTGYRSRSVSMGGLTGGAYGIADDSSTGITPIDSSVYQPIDTNGESRTKGVGYAIVTATGGVNATIEVDDCSFWFLPS